MLRNIARAVPRLQGKIQGHVTNLFSDEEGFLLSSMKIFIQIDQTKFDGLVRHKFLAQAAACC